MSTTIPTVFSGTPTVTPAKIKDLTECYVSMLGDMDKASDMEDAFYYWGYSDAMADALTFLHDNTTEAIKVIVKPSRQILTKKRVIIGVTAFVLYKNRHKIKTAVKPYVDGSAVKKYIDESPVRSAAFEKKYGTKNPFGVFKGPIKTV